MIWVLVPPTFDTHVRCGWGAKLAREMANLAPFGGQIGVCFEWG